jgi:RES domain-containing protein
MPQAWRIVKAKHATTAFSGEGAAKTGGRWNSRGVPVVYASSTKSKPWCI